MQIGFAVTAVLLLAACKSRNKPVSPAADEVEILPTETAVPTVKTSPTATTAPALQLPDLGAAPEINNEIWLNTSEPVTLASVQGEKAVLLEFWTFG